MGGDVTAAFWIENWLEECKQKTMRTRICLGEALRVCRRVVGVSMVPQQQDGLGSRGTPSLLAVLEKD